MLVSLSVLWGGSFFFAKIAVGDLPPLTLALGRVAIAATLLDRARARHRRGLPRDRWGPFLVMGLLNNALPFSLIFWGQTHIPSGLAAILNATTPLVHRAGGAFRDRRRKAHRRRGLPASRPVSPGSWSCSVRDLLRELGAAVAAQLACLAAAVSYAFAGIYGRRFRGEPALRVAAGQLVASTALLAPVVVVLDRPWTLAPPSATAWAALVALAAFSTALGYLLYFRILARVGATNLLLVTFLIPVSAILLGSWCSAKRSPRAISPAWR